MKKEVKVTAECMACHTKLPENHSGPCPKCGSERKHTKVYLSDMIKVFDKSFGVKEIKYKKRDWLLNLLASILTTIGAAMSLYIFRTTISEKFVSILLPLIVGSTLAVAIASGIYLYYLRKKNQRVSIEKLKDAERYFFNSIQVSISNFLEGK